MGLFKVGLTGGIGSGKSTVAELFISLGVSVIDADQVAREVVEVGEPALLRLKQEFGERVITAQGKLNRAVLSDIIFSDAKQKQRLEAILHPLIFKRMQLKVDTLKSHYPYCILAIPLLFESQMCGFVDRVLVIDCPEALQIERVMARDQHSEAKIRAIIQSQIPRQIRCEQANDLINNLVEKSHLAQQVKTLHNLYLTLSQSPY